jgi:alpha-D-ribose 1-methylphosphonate 5-triphosphate diphosphatase PhnM
MRPHWIECGHASLITWLVQADPSLADAQVTRRMSTRVNANEFAQLELYDSKASEHTSEDLDLVSLAAHGPGPSEFDYVSINCARYASLLSRFTFSGGFRKQNLAAFIDVETA